MSVVIVSTHDACKKDLVSPTWCPLKSELFIGKALGSALYTDPDTIPKNLNASLSQASLPQLPHPSLCPLTRKTSMASHPRHSHPCRNSQVMHRSKSFLSDPVGLTVLAKDSSEGE